MNRNFTEKCAAYAVNAESDITIYWTQAFGRSPSIHRVSLIFVPVHVTKFPSFADNSTARQAFAPGVDLGAGKNRDPRQIEPEQQHDDGTQRTVCDVVV